MMYPYRSSHRPGFPRQRRQGFALIIVLSILVLLMVLVVGFISRVGTERSAAAGAQASVSSRQLADTAVNLVQGQIQLAATQGSSVAWVSQPGMVRTFDTTGKLLSAYKLYSAADMVGNSVNLTADLPAATWQADTAHWTDLNSPVEANGSKQFPIFDPSALDPEAPPTTKPPQGLTLASPAGNFKAYQPAPMPVRWLYVLRDGSMVVPTNTSGTTANISGASKTNPVVGRVAFWTDDDTTKINVNTASEGTYWDVPRANSQQDRALGNYQPSQKEFQRYPGHPAMTSLSAAFPALTPQQIFAITPRVSGGGSDAGTQIATAPISPDTDRLYANLDELIFRPNRSDNGGLTRAQLEQTKFVLTAHSRAPEVNLFNLPRVAIWPIFKDLAADRVTAFDQLIAFASSINGNPYYFQREDAMSPTNDINIPRNKLLYSYLQTLTGAPVPGFGNSFAAKYDDDRDQILTEIFDYIRSTNLYDDNLANGKGFAAGRSGLNMLPGHGWVTPAVKTSNNTMGFGRGVTISEVALGFICNASPDDQSTTGVDESSDSNDPSTNTVLGGTKLDGDQRFIQAILVMEFFAPSQGYTIMRPSLSVEVEGLQDLRISSQGTTHDLFPSLAMASTSYSADPNAINAARNVGGTFDFRHSLSAAYTSPAVPSTIAARAKGAPARSPLSGDAGEVYPFIGVPIRIKVPPASAGVETMTLEAGQFTIRIYGDASTAPTALNLIQTIRIQIPEQVIPIPKLATGPQISKYPSANSDKTDKRNWWSFSKTGSMAGFPGRLSFVANPPGNYLDVREGQFFRTDVDVVRSFLPRHGDYRLIAGNREVGYGTFAPHRLNGSTKSMYASNLMIGSGTHGNNGYDQHDSSIKPQYIAGLNYGDKIVPDIYAGATLAERPESTGDFDTGIGMFMDGPYINKPDEGNTYRGTGNVIPYYDEVWQQTPAGPTFFSPNRQVPSAGMFGSLPTGIKADVPWRTLLFRPQSGHFGATAPADHLLLDLFWMPVVEPYAISDRFSTAGKINMNYQILPFTYINRATAWHGLLKSEKVAAFPDNKSLNYKNNTILADQFRMPINIDATLSQFTQKFSSGGVFRSASEICDLWMVPDGQTVSTMSAFWSARRLTGENIRERIYTTLYPRLTTKSNTYTVHFRAQSLRKIPTTGEAVWEEGKDQVVGEYRGSTSIERFIDASNPDIPDYAGDPSQALNKPTLDSFYKWRVIGHRQFAP